MRQRTRKIRRRQLLIAAWSAAAALHAPFGARAQQAARAPGKLWRIGFIWGPSRAATQARIERIFRKLRELGYIEGRDFTALHRWADANSALIPGFAAEFVRLKVDLIVTSGTEAAQAARAATTEIPVVFAMVSDPVASKIVNTLARPGGNVTGWTNMLPDTSEKMIELIKGMVPKMARLAVLTDPGNPGKVLEVAKLKQAAGKLGLTLRIKDLSTAADVDNAFAQMPGERTDAIIVLVNNVTLTHRQRVVDLAGRHRLPAIYQVREFVDAGGLMSFGLNFDRLQERTAEYMHRIFQGKKPMELPVEQPTHVELVINRRTATTLGIAISRDLLLRAEEVIE